MNEIDLKGRRAVVTGGAQGIGRSIAERFLLSGASVAIWDMDAALLRSTAQELGASGPVHHVAVDLTLPDAVQAAFESTKQAFGGVDILVANAGHRRA